MTQFTFSLPEHLLESAMKESRKAGVPLDTVLRDFLVQLVYGYVDRDAFEQKKQILNEFAVGTIGKSEAMDALSIRDLSLLMALMEAYGITLSGGEGTDVLQRLKERKES